MREHMKTMYGVTRRGKGLVLFVWDCTLLLLVVGAAGCGNPRTVPVSGRVTLEGAPVGSKPVPMWPAKISFKPTETGADSPLRPASSKLDGDGNYELSTFEPGDGVMPGDYQVVILSPGDEVVPGENHSVTVSIQSDATEPEVWEVPSGEAGQSGLSVTVPEQRTPLTFNFELKR